MPSRLLLTFLCTLLLNSYSGINELYASSFSEDPISYRAAENLRGNCQRELSGFYLSLLDQKKLPHDESLVLKKHKAILEAKRGRIKKQITTTTIPENAYNAKGDLQANLQQSGLTAIEVELKNIAILENEKFSAAEKAQKKITTFENLLAPALFIKEKKIKSGSLAYNKSVAFQYTCPKHDESCLLIEAELKTFEKLDDRGFLTPICRKFLRLSRAQSQ